MDEENIEVVDLTRVITEIELDNALIEKSPGIQSFSSQDSPSLGDSGSSSSSLLGKLEDRMTMLKNTSQHEITDEFSYVLPKRELKEQTASQNEITVTLDLRSPDQVGIVL